MGAETDLHSKTAAANGDGQGGQTDLEAKTGQVSNRLTSATPEERNFRKLFGRWLSVGIVASAAVLGMIILFKTNYHPRADDATVLANYIGIAPQVEGPLVSLPIQDNQFVRKGELLFEIDDRPFQYALERALSDQATLEGQIGDETRRIAALQSAVSVSEANIHSAEADVATVEQGVGRAQAEWVYASTNLHRLEQLLATQAVSTDDVDKAKTSEIMNQEALRQAKSQLTLAQAQIIDLSLEGEIIPSTAHFAAPGSRAIVASSVA